MGFTNRICKLILIIMLGSSQAFAAAFFNNRMVVQGYLKQSSTPLNDAVGFPMKFILKKNGTAVWCQTSATNVIVASGIFNTLLSGTANCSSLTNTLDPTALTYTANSDLFTIDVVVDVSKNGFGGADDATFAGIDMVASPFAIACNQANTAISATTATSATSATTATTATNVSGTVAIANGGTGAITAAAARTALGLGTVAVINTSGVASDVLHGNGTWSAASGSGDMLAANNLSELTGTAATARTNLGLGTAATSASTAFATSGANINITSLTGLTTALSIAQGGTSATTALGAINAISPLTTKGDLAAHNGTNNVRVSVGSNGQILTADSTNANGVKWGNNVGTIFAGSLAGATVTVGTRYISAASTTSSATLANRQIIMPTAGTLRDFYFVTTGAEPAGATLVLTINVNGINSSVTVTVPSSSAAATFSDTVNTVAVAAGNLVTIQAVAATATSATIGAFSFRIIP